MNSILTRLLDLRRKKRLSQNELGQTVGVSREMIGKYERGEATPSLEIAIKISRALDVSLDYLIGERENATFDFKTIKLVKEIENLTPDLKDKLFFLTKI